jgi:hypothetical protein
MRRRCNAHYTIHLPHWSEHHFRCELRDGHDTADVQALHHAARTTGRVVERMTWRVHNYDYTIPIERRAPHLAWPFGDPLG